VQFFGTSRKNRQTLLVFHTAYTFEQMQERELLFFATGRDINKVFSRVITVNVASHLHGKQNSRSSWFAVLQQIIFDERHIFYETRIPKILMPLPRKARDIIILSLSWLHLTLKLIPQNIKLVRAEDARLNSIFAFSLKFLHRSPILVGIWGNPQRLREKENRAVMPNLFPNASIEEKFESYFLKKADAILVQNEENASMPRQLNIDEKKIFFFPVGMTLNPVHFSGKIYSKVKSLDSISLEFITSDDSPLIICISRLEPFKHVEDCILALAKNKSLPAKMMVVGDGSERRKLEKLVDHHNLSHRVYFAGNRSQTWLAGSLTLADINLVPGWGGRVMLETAHYGIPTLAYDIDWHSEIIENNVNGFLVPYRNVDALATVLGNLISHPKKYKRIGLKLRETSLRLSDPINLAEIQLKLYSSIIS